MSKSRFEWPKLFGSTYRCQGNTEKSSCTYTQKWLKMHPYFLQKALDNPENVLELVEHWDPDCKTNGLLAEITNYYCILSQRFFNFLLQFKFSLHAEKSRVFGNGAPRTSCYRMENPYYIFYTTHQISLLQHIWVRMMSTMGN